MKDRKRTSQHNGKTAAEDERKRIGRKINNAPREYV